MRLFISDSQQRSAAAPKRLFANYSVNIIHYDLLRFCDSDITESIFCFSPSLLLRWGKALYLFDFVKGITLSSIEVTEQSELLSHREGACFLAVYVKKKRITKSVVQWPLIVLYGVHVISAVVGYLSAYLQEVMRKPSPCLPCSILQAQRQGRQGHKGL